MLLSKKKKSENALSPNVIFSFFSEMVNRKFVLLTLIIVYFNAFFWCLTPMFGWGKYGPDTSGISCALEWRDLPLSYVITSFTLLFALPIAIIIFCYSCIIREVYITQKGTQMIRKRMDIYMVKVSEEFQSKQRYRTV